MDIRDEGARSFARVFEQLADGDLHAEASDALHKLTKLLRALAKERESQACGRITIVLDIEIDKKGMAEIEGSITVKEPKPPKRRGILYTTAGGNLTAEDPRQKKLPLREVPNDSNAPREAGAREVK